MLKLRPYQEKAVEEVLKGAGESVLVEWATGLGKTILACEVARKRGGRTLFIAHRDELLQQAKDKMATVAPEVTCGIVKGDLDQWDAPMVLGSIQTISREERLRVGAAIRWNTIVVDEAHHAAAESYKKVLDSFQAGLVLGITATPERTDKKKIGFEREAHRMTLLQGISQGYLCDVKAKKFSVAGLRLSEVKITGGDYADGALGEALGKAGAAEAIVRAVAEHAGDRKKVLSFSPTVAEAVRVCEVAREGGMKAAFVHGGMALDDRRAILKGFAEGRYRLLSNCAVLLEGYDEPAIDCVVIGRPTKSKLLYQQMLGRGTRLAIGKDDLLVLDLTGMDGDYEAQSATSLFGLRAASMEQGISATLAAAKQAAGDADVKVAMAEALGGEFVDRRRLHWIADGMRWLLPLGQETVVLARGAGAWDIYTRERGVPMRRIYAGLTLEYAQGVVEDRVRAANAWGLASSGAAWRARPASDKQRETFTKMKMSWREGLTSGEAADMLTRRFMR